MTFDILAKRCIIFVVFISTVVVFLEYVMKSFMWYLLTRIQASMILFPAFFVEEESEKDKLIDEIEGELIECTAELDLPYIRPQIGSGCVSLLHASFALFLKKYVKEVQRACRSGVNFVYL